MMASAGHSSAFGGGFGAGAAIAIAAARKCEARNVHDGKSTRHFRLLCALSSAL